MCPACKSYLRFDPSQSPRTREAVQPLRIEGTVRHQGDGAAWEYNVLVTITNEKGEEVGRHVVGVGALRPDERRQVALTFEVFIPPGESLPPGLASPSRSSAGE